MAAAAACQAVTGKAGERALDAWSWVHLASGAGLAIVRIPPIWALAILVAYEALEGVLRRVPGHNGKGLFEHESWPNVVADVAVATLGYVLAWALVSWRPVPW